MGWIVIWWVRFDFAGRCGGRGAVRGCCADCEGVWLEGARGGGAEVGGGEKKDIAPPFIAKRRRLKPPLRKHYVVWMSLFGRNARHSGGRRIASSRQRFEGVE